MFDLVKSGDLSVVEFRAIAAHVLGDENIPSRARVNAAANGTEPFGYKDQEAKDNLKAIMDDLLDLKREFRVPINFSKIEDVAKIIRDRRAEREKQIARWWYVIRTLDGYFVRIQDGKIISSGQDKDAAPSQKLDVVTAVEARLKVMGNRAGHILLNGGRTMDEMLTNVEQFGFRSELVTEAAS
jgi:hypothetical protein